MGMDMIPGVKRQLHVNGYIIESSSFMNCFVTNTLCDAKNKQDFEVEPLHCC
jgi:hypothetical protein